MDWVEKKELAAALLKKYRFAVIILLAGFILMSIPEGKKDAPEETVAAEVRQEETDDLQLALEEILSKLEGAGKVKVLLSMASGSQTYYQTDKSASESLDSSDQKTDTVILTDADRSQHGLVQRIDPPVYLGALVLCQGGDSAAVRLAVVDAVSTVTGLTSDKISVLKMK